MAEKFTPRDGESPPDFISRCRKNLGLTKSQAAAAWDISPETRRKLESDPSYKPSEVIMIKLARGLDVEVETIEGLYRAGTGLPG